MKTIASLLFAIQLSTGFAATDANFRVASKDTIPYRVQMTFWNPKYCEEIIALHSPEVNQQYIYNAKIRIDTDADYSVGSQNIDIAMKAGRAIVLKPRSHIKIGSVYLARIEPCMECGIQISYPKFFTPNADSYNDVWKINWGDQYDNNRVEIFDRFGKLIKLMVSENDSWDGKYNGEALFSNDYWFKFDYKDCDGKVREYKSHFSLKR